MDKDFRNLRGTAPKLDFSKVPPRKQVYDFLDCLVSGMFPILREDVSEQEDKTTDQAVKALEVLLTSYQNEIVFGDMFLDGFNSALPGIYEAAIEDALAICAGDPAACSIEEVIATYPGFYAILVYRIAHTLHCMDVPVIPRMLSEYAHRQTGIDIHPGAKIGPSFCIDHGTGIVIGETTEIGSNVKIYQGVTLGASSVEKEKAGIKRHPTIEDNVVVYSGTTILGGDTRIGHHSIVGGNVWLTHSIQAYSLVINRSEVHLIDKHPERDTIIDFVI